ncbi:MAG: hypothetical protein MUF53_06445, partial [Gemmatimonadaceae bacterium]|nr:hypothetical protein [Gemmatimonadaceae bacterium]
MTAAAPPRPPADPREGPSAPLTVERYVQLLYPRLAWEATLRLGDPSTAGRLVERVLHRAWRERDRFAAGDALMRHASESAEAAIAREEGRRLAVTRFDAEEAAVGLPGDLSPLSTHAVAERLRSGRSPMPTPPSSVAIPPREAATAGDGAAVPVASPPAGEELHTREHHRPGRASWATPHAAPATASRAVTAAGATADSGTTATASHRTSTHPTGRPHLRSASYIARPSRRLSPRMLGLGIGGVLVAVVALWRLT